MKYTVNITNNVMRNIRSCLVNLNLNTLISIVQEIIKSIM